MRKDRAAIVAQLEAQGLVFRSFVLTRSSPHAVEDWDWNQRDLPHIPFVHGDFRAAPLVLEEDHASVVYLQKVLGLRVPMTVVYHHLEGLPRRRVYTATLGPLAVVIGSSLAERDGGTSMRTHYSVGAMRWARGLLPLAERLLRRNAGRLVEEDAPLLTRRSALRRWGFGFRTDHEGAAYDRSLELKPGGVLPPAERAPFRLAVELDGVGEEASFGRSDDRGIRVCVDRARQQLAVFPRMCSHAGAPLDGCPVEGGHLRCPWHGRRVGPMFQAPLDGAARGEAEGLVFELEAGVLSVSSAP